MTRNSQKAATKEDPQYLSLSVHHMGGHEGETLETRTSVHASAAQEEVRELYGESWVCDSGMEHSPNIGKARDSVPRTRKKEDGGKKKIRYSSLNRRGACL